MWKEHDLAEDEGSLLLTQFTAELKKAVASQREEPATSACDPEAETHNQLDFGDCRHHFFNTHYLHSPSPPVLSPPSAYQDGEKLAYLSPDALDTFEVLRREEVSVFHLLGWSSHLVPPRLRRLRSRWRHVCREKERGVVLVYL